MSILIKLSLTIALIAAQSCDSTKKVTEASNSQKEDLVMNEKLLSEGYSLGFMEYDANAECNYIIVDAKSKAKLDPINMESEKFEAFKSKSNKVYFKYRSLRRTNRCSDARPVEVLEMQKAL